MWFEYSVEPHHEARLFGDPTDIVAGSLEAGDALHAVHFWPGGQGRLAV